MLNRGEQIVREARVKFENLEKLIKSWNWNDDISKLYAEIFTPDTVREVKRERSEIVADLQFRTKHNIAPGFKDKAKSDGGIGDLIIWLTVQEIGRDLKRDVVFVTDDQKNDWFYKQDKESIYPRFELFDEFRRETDGMSISILSFPEFLAQQNAKEETINEIVKHLHVDSNVSYSRTYTHKDLWPDMKVLHRRFGQGVVKQLYRSKTNKEWVEFYFANAGSKKFLLKNCDLHVPETADNLLIKIFTDKNIRRGDKTIIE